MTLRIATQNIWGRVPLWSLRKRAIARALRRADIVVLQEVQARGGNSSQAHELAREMNLPFTSFTTAGRTLGWREGVAIISCFPITHVACEKFRPSRTNLIDRLAPRSVLRVVVQTPDGTLEVYGLHLSLSKSVRTRCAAEVVDFARRQRSLAPAQFSAVAGDFNASSHEPCLTEIQRGCGVTDVHPPTPGRRAKRRTATFPALWPQRRLDYLLLSPNLRPLRVERRKSLGSDHCGVIAHVTPS